ncbi:hypothetical protein [Pelobacter propionicus]|uniref:Uncharacterized protein n=1 Tax=Pelobacter propionicus (strain DSM 2379 / NBRC 103807 / OttBd1) TaxID=338966 RepID=A1ARN0_PELPD|nr:hypothetical protein [Pelobacter propionicus]ABL00001.1 hypothetical protein Ppro_2394 [Pelobacter propionicus DSM 2379]
MEGEAALVFRHGLPGAQPERLRLCAANRANRKATYRTVSGLSVKQLTRFFKSMPNRAPTNAKQSAALHKPHAGLQISYFYYNTNYNTGHF